MEKQVTKILFVESNVDGTVGGSHFSLLHLVRGLNKGKFEPYVVFYQRHRLLHDYEAAGARIILFDKPRTLDLTSRFNSRLFTTRFGKFTLIPVKMTQKLFNFFIDFIFPIPKCYRILKKEGISIVHLNNTLLRPKEWIAASCLGNVKVVAHERGINNIFPLSSRLWSRYMSRVVCISDAVEINLLKHGFPEDLLIRIYNGIDPNLFKPQDPEGVREEFSLTNGNKVIGVVGNLKKWKGQHIVIKALPLVKRKFQNFKCLIIGGYAASDENYYNSLTELAELLNVGENVVFTGLREDVPDLVVNMDVLIHSSILPEPFGRVLLEGMALSKPVITNSIGAGFEIVVDGKTGLVIPPEDHETLASAIVTLLENDGLAEQMGRAGKIRLDAFFHIDKNTQQTIQMYEDILAG